MTTKRIRILIVDDSSVVRELLKSLLIDAGDFDVVGEACNGKEAIALVQQLRPDVVTMDLNMPVMSGLEAIEHIMHDKAVPILVVSNESDAELAYEAINIGALDVIAKPCYEADSAAMFVSKVRLLAGVPVITRLRRRALIEPYSVPVPVALPLCVIEPDYLQVFVIASSTGGPQALAHLLSQLPAEFPAPILIAQHISDGFIDGMALWLSGLCQLTVKVAEQGERLRAGYVYLSPSEQHLTVSPERRVKLIDRLEGDIYHPCCDTLLKSVAEVYSTDAIGIIMTGMGRDGSEGMRAIYQCGGITFAQDEASSVIYGMNAEAINKGVIHSILPLSAIADEMLGVVALGVELYRTTLHRATL